MFQGDRCWRKSPADFGQAGGQDKLFLTFPGGEDAREAFSEEGVSLSQSAQLHSFPCIKTSQTWQGQCCGLTEEQHCVSGFQAPAFVLFSPLSHLLPSSTVEIIPIGSIYVPSALLFSPSLKSCRANGKL